MIPALAVVQVFAADVSTMYYPPKSMDYGAKYQPDYQNYGHKDYGYAPSKGYYAGKYMDAADYGYNNHEAYGSYRPTYSAKPYTMYQPYGGSESYGYNYGQSSYMGYDSSKSYSGDYKDKPYPTYPPHLP